MSMKTRRMSSKPVNKRQMKTSDRRKNIKSKPTAKGSGDMSKNSRSRSRILRKNKGLKTSPKKRVANKQSKDITIRRSSGRREKFSTERMAQTVSRSGVPFIMARDISKRIAKRVKNRPSVSTKQHRNKNTPEKRKVPRGNKIITAGKVRQMVAEELIGRNRPDIANSYSGNPPENTTKHIYDSTVGKQQGIDKSSVDTQHSRRNEVIHDQSKRGGGIMT
jgi:transcriptional repressor NrdR